ncbi:putative glycerate kinase [Flexivirga endophytica]|uniref:Glycerate kinase n=1 Tax=Flexivirga endophytica TaxID=1849103 RepID=A0A916SW37_9MICO|nr:putative glycerate kinase [Flexivirga endophytica]GHB71034.1 putative glycerate kinase [Flexivirga endophytica]
MRVGGGHNGAVRVLICGDHWGDLAAADVTSAIASGWQERQPTAEVVAVPFSSGGQGFVATVAASLNVDPEEAQSHSHLCHGDAHYLDGAALTGGGDSGPLGAAIADAVDAGAKRIVVGVGDAAGVDGGAGLMHALGRSADLALALPQAVERTHGVELVAAYKEDIALLGLKGASATAVDTLGWTKQQAQDAEACIGEFVAQVRRILPPRTDLLTGKVHRLDRDPGSGAGGGVGFALGILGARMLPGADFFAEIVGLDRHVAAADLVVVATRIFDWRSLAYDTVATTVQAATAAATPAIVLAERLDVGRRETMSLGASAAYPLTDPHSLRRRMDAEPRAALAALARRVAGTWSAT